jgi:hypothetical protein
MTSRPRRAALALAVLAVTPFLLRHGVDAEILRKAAGVSDSANPTGAKDGGLHKFVAAANELVTPAVVAMAAIAPLACVVGAGALMFGNRRGLVIIGAALGTLVFVASIKGIVA